MTGRAEVAMCVWFTLALENGVGGGGVFAIAEESACG